MASPSFAPNVPSCRRISLAKIDVTVAARLGPTRSPTDSTGRRQRVIRPVDDSTTLVEAGKLATVKAVAKSTEHFPFGV